MTAVTLCLGQELQSNSGFHVTGLARALEDLGVTVSVLSGGGEPDGVITVGQMSGGSWNFETTDWLKLGRHLQRLEPADIVHVWTTRPLPTKLGDVASWQGAEPRRVVHLEDNEVDILSRMAEASPRDLTAMNISEFGDRYGAVWAHPRWHDRIVDRADGYTILADEVRPDSRKPVVRLVPAVDGHVFVPASPDEKRRLRRTAGIADGDFVVVFTGNVHRAIAGDFASLLDAVLLLRRDGLPVRLMTSGGIYEESLAPDVERARGGWQHLGWLSHRQVRDLMACADAAVQPGHDNAYNRGRYPSKLPEFLSMELPTIVTSAFPQTGEIKATGAALVVDDGSALGLAEALRSVVVSETLRDRLREGARSFAAEHFNWRFAGALCLSMYEDLMRSQVQGWAGRDAG